MNKKHLTRKVKPLSEVGVACEAVSLSEGGMACVPDGTRKGGVTFVSVSPVKKI